MCNACGFLCCAWDGLAECGCDCSNPNCWERCPNCGALEQDACACGGDDEDAYDPRDDENDPGTAPPARASGFAAAIARVMRLVEGAECGCDAEGVTASGVAVCLNPRCALALADALLVPDHHTAVPLPDTPPPEDPR